MLARRALLSLALLLAVPRAAPADTFVAGTEDVPLIAGLEPVKGSSVVFDKPQGRIVEAQARGPLSRRKVAAFYAATLPQLGWSAAGRNAWQREGEVLRLDFSGRDGHLTVDFTLSPQ